MIQAVADTTVLITFATLGREDLLHAVVQDLLIPHAVHREFMIPARIEPGRFDPAQVMARAHWIQVRAVDELLNPFVFPEKLGAGECEAILLAHLLNLPLLTDDGDARKFAETHGIAVVGSMGIIGRAKQLGFVAEARPLVMTMVARGLRLSDNRLRDFLRSMNEPYD